MLVDIVGIDDGFDDDDGTSLGCNVCINVGGDEMEGIPVGWNVGVNDNEGESDGTSDIDGV